MYKCGDIIKVKIKSIKNYGLFVSANDGYSGLIHISELSDLFVRDISSLYSVGDIINALVLDVDDNLHQLKLSIKRIRYSVNGGLSRIPEKGKGFDLIKEKLPLWTQDKIQEIHSRKK